MVSNIRVGRRPRQRRTVEEKRRIVEETLMPGVSVSVVARRHDVNANQLFSWRRQYRRGELGKGIALIPVGVIGKGGVVSVAPDCTSPKVARSSKPRLDPGSALHPAHCSEPLPVIAVSKQPKMIEVELRSGTRIRVDADVKGSALQQVLKLIRSLA